MDKIKEYVLAILGFALLYFFLCIIVSLFISFFKLVFKREPFFVNFKEVFLNSFLEILNPYNYLF
ncbi:hypothetical protein EB54_02537 [Enterococcus gallinarum]|nr:hypothetical protein EB54_02537 [Enterococcus gallinarum]